MHSKIKSIGVAIALGLTLSATSAGGAEAVSKAEEQYHSSTAPSKAYRQASDVQRSKIKRAYLVQYGSWNNGCRKDMRHSFLGFTSKKDLKRYRGLPVEIVVQMKGRNVVFGEYTDGICGD